MTADDIAKLVLAFAVAISLLGVSIQLMKLLGTFNGMLGDVRYIGWKVTKLLEVVADDYTALKGKIGDLNKPFNMINKGFLRPVGELAVTVGTFAKVGSEYLKGRK